MHLVVTLSALWQNIKILSMKYKTWRCLEEWIGRSIVHDDIVTQKYEVPQMHMVEF